MKEELLSKERRMDEMDEINMELKKEREYLSEKVKSREDEVKMLKEVNENIRESFYL